MGKFMMDPMSFSLIVTASVAPGLGRFVCGGCVVSPSPDPVASATAKPSTSRACALRPICFHHTLEAKASATCDGGVSAANVRAKSQMWLLRLVGPVPPAAQETINCSNHHVCPPFNRVAPEGAATYVAAMVATPDHDVPTASVASSRPMCAAAFIVHLASTAVLHHRHDNCSAMLPMTCPCWK